MKDLTVFKFEEKEVRTVVRDGEPWFVGKDVCDFFNDSDYKRSLSRLDDSDKSIMEIKDRLGRNQQATTVNESGLFTLLFGFQPEKANKDGGAHMLPQVQDRLDKLKKFKKWVTSEVLPSIRKHGIYATEQTIDNILNNPDFGIELLTKLKEERQARIEAQNTVTILTHTNKTYTATEIAKELNLKSAKVLNDKLVEDKIQYMSNGTWVLTSKYSGLALTDIKQQVLDSGKVVYNRHWTNEGRKFLLSLYGTSGKTEEIAKPAGYIDLSSIWD